MRGAQPLLSGEPFAVGERRGPSPQADLSDDSSLPQQAAPLAITCGDPAGVGPELIEAVLKSETRELGSLAVIGPAQWLDTLPDFVEKVAVGDSAFCARAGVPSEAGARVALAAMECAAAGCVSGRFSGVVTGPVSKSQLAKVGYPFPGQTEFFAARWGGDSCGSAGGDQCASAGGEPVMGFVGERLRLVLATWHVPLAEVPNQLSEPVIERTVAAAGELAHVGKVAGEHAARIAVCGLNPHAGEGGLLGVEERDFLNPILEKLSARYAGLVPQCLPGDTVFARALRGEFDVIVALYHDQGLAPLKIVDFDTAVNVTLGLPFVRTSPDHGTAFDLAGKGTASPKSFANAIRLARNLLRERSRA